MTPGGGRVKFMYNFEIKDIKTVFYTIFPESKGGHVLYIPQSSSPIFLNSLFFCINRAIKKN